MFFVISRAYSGIVGFLRRFEMWIDCGHKIGQGLAVCSAIRLLFYVDPLRSDVSLIHPLRSALLVLQDFIYAVWFAGEVSRFCGGVLAACDILVIEQADIVVALRSVPKLRPACPSYASSETRLRRLLGELRSLAV